MSCHHEITLHGEIHSRGQVATDLAAGTLTSSRNSRAYLSLSRAVEQRAQSPLYLGAGVFSISVVDMSCFFIWAIIQPLLHAQTFQWFAFGERRQREPGLAHGSVEVRLTN